MKELNAILALWFFKLIFITESIFLVYIDYL